MLPGGTMEDEGTMLIALSRSSFAKRGPPPRTYGVANHVSSANFPDTDP